MSAEMRARTKENRMALIRNGAAKTLAVLLVAGCKAAVTWALMRLKKYNMPIQVIPATKWIQRKSA